MTVSSGDRHDRSLPPHASISSYPSALHSLYRVLKAWLGTMSILGSGSSHMQGSRGVSFVFQLRKHLVVALSVKYAFDELCLLRRCAHLLLGLQLRMLDAKSACSWVTGRTNARVRLYTSRDQHGRSNFSILK